MNPNKNGLMSQRRSDNRFLRITTSFPAGSVHIWFKAVVVAV